MVEVAVHQAVGVGRAQRPDQAQRLLGAPRASGARPLAEDRVCREAGGEGGVGESGQPVLADLDVLKVGEDGGRRGEQALAQQVRGVLAQRAEGGGTGQLDEVPGGELAGALPDGQQVSVGVAELALGGEAGMRRRFDGNLPDQQAAGAVMGGRADAGRCFLSRLLEGGGGRRLISGAR
ncbi:hypothetical protein [Deinococcus aestuarii]|uniref:hypothetical protein n=1 Tax=Deinococcus aestuarii TaxID=2774531 RepID=UPI001C0CC367|nr:hypothetical protein [Deinococcus aestuarii]